jgi:hypothetical protein
MDWLPLASLFLLTRVAPVSSGASHSLNEGQAQRLIQQGEHMLDQAALLAS